MDFDILVFRFIIPLAYSTILGSWLLIAGIRAFRNPFDNHRDQLVDCPIRILMKLASRNDRIPNSIRYWATISLISGFGMTLLWATKLFELCNAMSK